MPSLNPLPQGRQIIAPVKLIVAISITYLAGLAKADLDMISDCDRSVLDQLLLDIQPAHLQLAALRSLGVPARYVSGYLETAPPPGMARLIGADASHAWVSVFCGDEAGWIDVDPTNNLMPNERHITVAWGRDYSDVSPLRGVTLGAGDQRLSVAVDVMPVE